MEYTGCGHCLSWILWPAIIVFLLPLMVVGLIYQSVIILSTYALFSKLLGKTYDLSSTSSTVAKVHKYTWHIHGWIWHGYEVRGLENLPKSEGALIVPYHGALPMDIYYLMAYLFLNQKKLLSAVADRFLFKVPGVRILLESIHVIPGSLETCSNSLKEGSLLAIAPGGVYESQFSHEYNLLWKNRLGFAKVALDAKVPIIPMFTENLRESYRTVSMGKWLWLKIYNATKFPFTPIYGGYPVKLITHLGKPIPYDPELSPEQLKMKVATAIEELIATNQRRPPSILQALLDRIPALRVKAKEHAQ